MGFALKIDSADQSLKTVPLTEDKVLIGSLLSNHVVLKGKGVDPIHALVEQHHVDSTEKWIITDLGSERGIILNGKKIDVEAEIRPADVAEIGSVKIILELVREGSPKSVIPVISKEKSSDSPAKTAEQRAGDSLFNIKKARPRGRVLEVVAYWGDTILEAEYFHKDFKDFNCVTIGSIDKSHFIAANEDPKVRISRHVLAKFTGDGSYRLNLLNGMTTRIHKGGKVIQVKGKKRLSVGKRDVVHINYGAVNYFFIFVKPPSVILPPASNRDPLFTSLLLIGLLLYFVTIPMLWYVGAKTSQRRKDDIWAVVYKPTKKAPPIKKAKPPVIKKKINKVKDRKPLKKPPPPKKLESVKPAKPIEKPKPIKKAIKPPKKRTAVKALRKPVKTKSAGVVSRGRARKKPAARTAGSNAGLRSSGVGKRTGGGARKGKSKNSVKGVSGAKNKKASGPNLSKLGVGVGMVLSKRGAGAQYTDFKSSAGGAGGGRGSRLKTTGIGGGGREQSLSLAGSKGALDTFGTGTGVLAGGGRGSGLGKGFGRGKGRGGVNINIPLGDPVVSGGLSASEISGVIRRNLNQIRHCYERLLQRQPDIVGKASVKFVIKPNGLVGSVNIVRSDISNRSFRSCISGTIKRWKFPKPRNNSSVTVNYPFAFNPV